MSDRRMRGLETTTSDIDANNAEHKKYIYDTDKGHNVYRIGAITSGYPSGGELLHFVMTRNDISQIDPALRYAVISPVGNITISGDITVSTTKSIGLGLGDSRIEFPASGVIAVSDTKLAIGTTTPTAKFQINNADYSTTPLSIWDTGENGIDQVLTVKNSNYETKIHVQNEYNPAAPGGPIVTTDLTANSGGTNGVTTLNVTSTNTPGGATVFQLQLDGVNQLVVLNTGIGFGTDTPSTKLHLYDAVTPPVVTLESATGSSTLGYLTGDLVLDNVTSSSSISLGTTIHLDTADTARLNISASGLVGINRLATTYHLEVAGNALVQGTAGFDTSGEIALMYLGNSSYGILAQHSQGLWLYSGTTCMQADTSGNVGFGADSTAAYKVRVTGKLQVTSDIENMGGQAYIRMPISVDDVPPTGVSATEGAMFVSNNGGSGGYLAIYINGAWRYFDYTP